MLSFLFLCIMFEFLKTFRYADFISRRIKISKRCWHLEIQTRFWKLVVKFFKICFDEFFSTFFRLYLWALFFLFIFFLTLSYPKFDRSNTSTHICTNPHVLNMPNMRNFRKSIGPFLAPKHSKTIRVEASKGVDFGFDLQHRHASLANLVQLAWDFQNANSRNMKLCANEA